MLNSVELIGRLVADPEVNTIEEGVKVSRITLAVHRPFKNTEGEYGVDYIPVSFWYGAANLTEQYCSKGDLIFVKGRLIMKNHEINEKNYKFLELIGERVVFLCHKLKTEENDIN